MAYKRCQRLNLERIEVRVEKGEVCVYVPSVRSVLNFTLKSKKWQEVSTKMEGEWYRSQTLSGTHTSDLIERQFPLYARPMIIYLARRFACVKKIHNTLAKDSLIIAHVSVLFDGSCLFVLNDFFFLGRFRGHVVLELRIDMKTRQSTLVCLGLVGVTHGDM